MSKLVELEVPARSVVLANELLHSLTVADLTAAGFTQADIDEFGEFFDEVRHAAENNEECLEVSYET